uniref:Fibronectin type-III domain-containing protein n=1 Tax=Denticeps clupeoides TaxID=299321 RepID=A0AAY4DUS6_9TELE
MPLKPCDVIPKGLVVKTGSDVTVSLKAPLDAMCRTAHEWSHFDLSQVYWSSNRQRIDSGYYGYNSTVATVFIPSISENMTVECHFQDQILGGTFIRIYATRNPTATTNPPEKPINISCTVKYDDKKVTCSWSGGRNSVDTTYVLSMQQNGKYPENCSTSTNTCSIEYNLRLGDANKVTVNVTASNSAGKASSQIKFDPWNRMQYVPPSIEVEPHPSKGLRVKLLYDPKIAETLNCEVNYTDHPTGSTQLVYSEIKSQILTLDINNVKPCTEYTVSARCSSHHSKVWSDWSKTVTKYSDGSSFPVHLWMRIVPNKDEVQLEWKGPSPACSAIDEYKVFVDRNERKILKSNQKNTTIKLNRAVNEITIAAYKNGQLLHNVSLKIPKKDLPPVQNLSASTLGDQINVNWAAPNPSVNGYILECFIGPEEYFWTQTQETHASCKGQPYLPYTVNVVALYNEGPGHGQPLVIYTKEKDPAKVSVSPVEKYEDTWAEVKWTPVARNACCAFVVNYTVKYWTSAGPVLNVTVDSSKHMVTLSDLQPNTPYSVRIVASSAASNSTSEPISFQTKPYGSNFIKGFVSVAIVLTLSLVISVFIFIRCKKVEGHLVPNPKFSSVGTWSRKVQGKIYFEIQETQCEKNHFFQYNEVPFPKCPEDNEKHQDLSRDTAPGPDTPYGGITEHSGPFSGCHQGPEQKSVQQGSNARPHEPGSTSAQRTPTPVASYVTMGIFDIELENK